MIVLISLNGVPGKGKTVSAVALALKHYKRENTLSQRLLRKKRGEEIYRNSVYSNVPILLDRKRGIYTRCCSIYDLNNFWRFLPNSLIIIDEAQAFFDSKKDFAEFPRSIATFLQFHRHFGVKDIIVIAQSPKRLVSYLRDICSYYNRIRRFIKIPIIHLGIISYRQVPEFENYAQAFTRDKDTMKMYDITQGTYIFNYKKVFKSFKTDYLKILNEDKPPLPRGCYTSLDMTDIERKFLETKLFCKQ